MRRLFVHIYLTVLATLLLFALLAGFAWQHLMNTSPQVYGSDIAAEIAAAVLPGPTEPIERQQEALKRLSAGGRIDLALYDAAGERIAETGRAIPPPDRPARPWIRHTAVGMIWTLDLPDGRALSVRLPHTRRGHPALGLFLALTVVGLAIAVGAYPATRRLTRRLERLKTSVEALGAGHLSARVPVEGRDEVAVLAASFNGAAERIERLVAANQTLLANASHELRSPLARIRMASGMLEGGASGETPPALVEEIRRNVTELDQLVDEILLASRLDARSEPPVRERVDLLALAAEECARTGATLDGTPTEMAGEARLLRRLIRNLLENARRYGGEQPAEVTLVREDSTHVLCVRDRGPGVAEAEREKIFEPFYRPAQAREQDGGYGLGLALVRQIARRHGGEVRCLPRDGGGACFEVRLPSRAPG